MKSILRLKQMAVVLLSVFVLTSCLKSEDDSFMIIGTGFYVQENVNDGVTITPHLLVQSTSYNYPLLICSGKDDEGNTFLFRKSTDSAYFHPNYTYVCTSGHTYNNVKNHTYTVTAQSTDQQVASTTITISATKPMSPLVSTLDYDATKREVTAKFNKVDETDYYAIFLEDSPYAWSKIWGKTYTETDLGKLTDRTVTVEIPSNFIEKLEKGKRYRLVTAAFTVSSYGGEWILYQEDQGKWIFYQEGQNEWSLYQEDQNEEI